MWIVKWEKSQKMTLICFSSAKLSWTHENKFRKNNLFEWKWNTEQFPKDTRTKPLAQPQEVLIGTKTSKWKKLEWGTKCKFKIYKK